MLLFALKLCVASHFKFLLYVVVLKYELIVIRPFKTSSFPGGVELKQCPNFDGFFRTYGEVLSNRLNEVLMVDDCRQPLFGVGFFAVLFDPGRIVGSIVEMES